MRVCLLGDFSENLDEGFKNTGHYLSDFLEADGDEVTRFNIKRFGSATFWRSLLKARPQIIHTIAQPTNASLLFAHLAGKLHTQAKTVLSALRPEGYFVEGQVTQPQRKLLQLFAPQLFLVQSAHAGALFSGVGCPVAYLPNGVDLERFAPADPGRQRALRSKYGLDLDRPVVLHVGHLETRRNLMALAPLTAAGIQVVIAGSLYMGTNNELIRQLEEAGFLLFKGYQPQVEELYMLSDCYVFPVPPGNSLSIPLSVLEAMACNLPVVTTCFAGLSDAFEEGNGLSYLDGPGDILPQVEMMLAQYSNPSTREMVRPYSWHAIVDKLRTYYRALLES